MEMATQLKVSSDRLMKPGIEPDPWFTGQVVYPLHHSGYLFIIEFFISWGKEINASQIHLKILIEISASSL